MTVAVERIRLKDTMCPLIRLDTARKRDRSLSFSLSLAVHILIFSLVGVSLIDPARFGVDQGENSIEVDLVAAPVETVPQEMIVPPAEEKKDFVEKEIIKPVIKSEPVTVKSVGGAITQSKPDYLRNPAPVYPTEARRRRQEGVVLLNVLVDKNGHPQKIDVKKSSGVKSLDNAAVEGVWQWTFQAAKLGPVPVESNVEIPVRFQLKER